MKNSHVDRLRLLALATVIAGIFYFYANIFAPGSIPRLLRIGTLRRPATILLAGTDFNFDLINGRLVASEGRTDSLILMRVDPVRNRLVLFSIPRDSFVEIPGHGLNKINAANVFGGTELVKQTIENLTGVHIDYYVKLNPEALTKMIDLIGGLKIYVEKDMYYVDRAQNLYINLKQGWHKLSGLEAQGYMRFRHDALGDIGRMGRQQKLMGTLFADFARPVNLLKAPLAVAITAANIQTDLSLTKLIRLANFVRMMPRSSLLTVTTTGEESVSAYAGDILIPNRGEIQSIIKIYF